jgi:hypothetical protein
MKSNLCIYRRYASFAKGTFAFISRSFSCMQLLLSKKICDLQLYPYIISLNVSLVSFFAGKMAQMEQQLPLPMPDLSTLRITTAVSMLGKAYGCGQCSGEFRLFKQQRERNTIGMSNLCI